MTTQTTVHPAETISAHATEALDYWGDDTTDQDVLARLNNQLDKPLTATRFADIVETLKEINAAHTGEDLEHLYDVPNSHREWFIETRQAEYTSLIAEALKKD